MPHRHVILDGSIDVIVVVIRSFGVLKRVWSRICLTCKVEVRRIPGLNPMAILQEPKGLVRGVPACVW